MKKKILNAFLMVALIASSMGTFVSCKDYDEDAYVDLRNRISNEVSLRETLQKQVDNLKQALAALEEAAKKHVTYDELNATLKNYLTKEEAAKTYVTINEYNQFVTNYQTWKIDIDNAIKDLKDRIGNIEKSMENMATKDDLAALWTAIDKANQAATDALGKANDAWNLGKENEERIKALEDLVGKLPTDWPEEFNPQSLWDAIKLLQEAVAGLPEEIANINIRVDSLCAVIDGYGLRITLLEQNFDSLSNVVSLQGDQILKLQEQIIEIQKEWNTKIEIILNQAIAVSDEAKELAQQALKKATEAVLAAEAANAKASNAEQLALNAFYMAQEACEIAKKLQEDLAESIKKAEDAAKKAEDAQKKAEDAADKAEKLLEEMKKLVGSGCECPKDLEERLKKAENDAAMAKEAADAAKKIAEALEDRVKTLEGKVSDLENKDKEHDAAIADLYDKLSKIVSGDCSCGDLKDKVDGLDDDIDELEKKADDLEDAIEDLEDAIKDLKADIDNQIYGIQIQATENPVIGYLNIPFNVHSNLLMSYYYNELDHAFEFPTVDLPKWVDPDEMFTAEEVAVMTNGGADFKSVPGYKFYSSSEGVPAEGPLNLGRVYMNINPSSTDFSGKTVTIINSKGEESPVTLTPIKTSDKLLTFGYDRSTRAGVGFYEAEASIDAGSINKIAVNSLVTVEDLLDRAKAALKNKSKSDVVSLIADLYNSVDNRVEANALKATWTDSEGNEKSVISDFSLGAAVVKPLSFNTLNQDRFKKGLPGKNFINKWIEKIISQIKIHFPDINEEVQRAIDAGMFSFETVNALKKDQAIITFTTTLNGEHKKFEVTINFDQSAKEAQDWDNFVKDATLESVKSGHNVSVEIAWILNDALPHAWKKSIETAKTDMINSMKAYVEDAFTKINGYVRIYELFDINLVAHDTSKGWTFVSQIANAPTTITSSTKLFPTSNSAEYVAPAFKKYIAISNVYDAATGAAVSDAAAKAAAAAGNNMNQVISGDTPVTVNGQAGYIYEISYAAVDYRGYQARQKFYVQF